jgi:hypothetical protein
VVRDRSAWLAKLSNSLQIHVTLHFEEQAEEENKSQRAKKKLSDQEMWEV